MKIAQICSSCQAIYEIADSVYKQMIDSDRIVCPCCGHSNLRQTALLKHGSQTVHTAKIYTVLGGKQEPMLNTRNFSRLRTAILSPQTRNVQPLENLQKKIAQMGRVFLLGTAPSLIHYDLDRLALDGWPTIGVNVSYKIAPWIDALVMADFVFICNNLQKIKEWQDKWRGKYLFWMRDTVRHGKELLWKEDSIHGRCIEKETGCLIFNQPTELRYSNVVYYDRRQTIVHDLLSPLELNFQDSVIFSAINLAYVLGAKEICLLGVEAERDNHFENTDIATDKKFPKGNKIIAALGSWKKALESKGCELYTCREEGKLSRVIKYRKFENLVNLEYPAHIERLRHKIQNKKKCFVFGAGASLNDLPLQKLIGWPAIGTNSSFYLYGMLDALIFGDIGFIDRNRDGMFAWQNEREEKPILFWAAHHFNDEERARFCRVVTWEHAPSSPIWENSPGGVPKFSLKRSIVTSAINCAFWLGAREIFLLGVDLNNDAHFWDPDEKVAEEWGKPVGKFPGGAVIADFVVQQAAWLKDRGVLLATCSKGGLLDGKVKYVSLNEAANCKDLNPNAGFGGQKKS